jgi:hypothetical protein
MKDDHGIPCLHWVDLCLQALISIPLVYLVSYLVRISSLAAYRAGEFQLVLFVSHISFNRF